MTVVEFFDGVSINNMVSCLTLKPEKIIFIGEKKLMKKQQNIYENFANKYEVIVSFEYRSINRNSVEQIVSVLSKIIETEDSCTFDLTGGEDLVLVAMGVVFERYKETNKVQMHRFNIRTGLVYDCDNDGDLPNVKLPVISVADNIMLYGGTIVPYDGEKGTYFWNWNDEFKSDVTQMWEICKVNPGLWNSQVNTFELLYKNYKNDFSEYGVLMNKTKLTERIKAEKGKCSWVLGLIRALCKNKLITNYYDDEEIVSFEFKNEPIKNCLTKAGTLLELVVSLHASDACDATGMKKYNDVATGVYIDWDASIHDIKDEEKDTENEIDVMLMRGVVPIFISCKNGYFDETELYKLNTVAERFGGPYSRKVLVSTYYGNNSIEGHKYFVQRAKDMNIQLIEDVHNLSNNEFKRKIKNIVF